MKAMRNGVVRCDDLAVSCDDLLGNAARVAQGLHSLNVGASDRIALLLRNCTEFLEISIGIGLVGAYAVPLNWHLRPQEIGILLRDCAPKALFVHADLLELVPFAACSGIRIVEVGADQYGSWLRENCPWTASPRPAPGSMIYTSGTTGTPKGVRRDPPTSEQQREMDLVRARLYRMNAGSRALIPTPLYHALANQFSMYAARHAAFLHIMSRFDAEELLALVESEQITSVVMAPIMFVRLMRLPDATRRSYDTSSLRWVLHAGGPCPIEIKKAMIDWWGPVIGEYYGGTETGPLTVCDSVEWLAHPGTCGRPLPDAVVHIADAYGNARPQGSAGEIFGRLRCYPDFTYHGDSAKRTSVALGDLVSLGDVGYLDEDGYLFLCDRTRDMIISGGVNIYPAEIESAMFTIAGVEDCAVVGIPDAEYGEAVIAFAAGNELNGEQLRTALKSLIAGYKVPREILVVPTLERDGAGKLRKALWRDRYIATLSARDKGSANP